MGKGGQWLQRPAGGTWRPAHWREGSGVRLHGECLRPVGASRAGRTRTGSRKDSVPLMRPRALSGPASGPGSRLVRAAKGSSGPPQPSSHSRLPFSSTALTDISYRPKAPPSPATCICPATDAAAGRRPMRLATGGTEPGAAHRGRASSLTQRPPRRAAA